MFWSLCSRGMEADMRAILETIASVVGMNWGRERVVAAEINWSTDILRGGSRESDVSLIQVEDVP